MGCYTKLHEKLCCCDCQVYAAHSDHVCMYTKGNANSCRPYSSDVQGEMPLSFLCKGCYSTITPEDSLPGRDAPHKQSKEAMIEQMGIK
jgi:hypothetical protein